MSRQRGNTLIERVPVTVILAVSTAQLLSTEQQAREAVGRSQCKYSIQQQG